MHTREGLIPTVLGTAVTTSGLAMKKAIPSSLAWGLVGFGLAHIVLGSIDLVEHRNDGEIIEG
ncbi:asparagine synthase [Dethiothermospora halolimnae]|uniref:asparagine synthase n=1 Tax=Dethiothermospora halolimnae TaxID=3114390 RepID=UPI003CCC34F7